MSPILKAYLDHGTALRKFLWRFYRRAEDVEDAAQEAFLRAFAAEARKSKDIDFPKQFLFRVAQNYALNDVAKKQNTATDMLEDLAAKPVLADDRVALADDQLDQRRRLAVFVESVAQLPPKCRQVFILRKVEGLKIKEIAVRLNISVSAVEKHIASGLMKCADYLSERGYQQEVSVGRSGRGAAKDGAPEKKCAGYGDIEGG